MKEPEEQGLEIRRRLFWNHIRDVTESDSDLIAAISIKLTIFQIVKKEKVQTVTCPSVCPDLNPTDQLCGILKTKVEQHKPPTKSS